MIPHSQSMKRRSWSLATALTLAVALLPVFPAAAAAPPVRGPADRFHELPPAWLNVVRDGPGIAVDRVEADVCARVVKQAHSTSAAGFRKALRTDLSYVHLCNNPADCRGQIVRIEGKLKRIQRLPPPCGAVALGLTDLYEAWIFSEHLGANPYCVVFTEWPATLPRRLLGKAKIKGDYTVGMDGFFFKKLRYLANDGKNTPRCAPLLIGRSLVVLGREEKVEIRPDRGLNGLASGVLGGFAVLLTSLFGLTWWSCRNDNRVRRRLRAWAPDFVLPSPAAQTAAARAGAFGKRIHGFTWTVLPPRNLMTAGAVSRAGKPPSSTEGGKRGSGDKPPEEDAGAQPRP